MGRKYYYLVSSLTEMTLESDHKGFDAVALRNDIANELSPRDKEYVKMLYTFYDVENVINAMKGKSAHNVLGNLSREEIEEELKNPEKLPRPIGNIIRAYMNILSENEDEDEDEDKRIDTSRPVEKVLWEAFYAECAKSGNDFIRNWFEFDKTLRNIYTAYTARANALPIAEQLVGNDEVTRTLSSSSAADFGLRNEIQYIDDVISLLDMKNILEKENRIDLIRWNKAEELTTFDYFEVDVILAYLVKVNIIHRWVALSPQYGREMFDMLISELINKERLEKSESNALPAM